MLRCPLLEAPFTGPYMERLDESGVSLSCIYPHYLNNLNV